MTVDHRRHGTARGGAYLFGLLLFVSQLLLLNTASASAEKLWQPENSTRGSLWLRNEQQTSYQPAPTLETAVTMDITAMLARVRVRQTFHNPAAGWAEGVYVFPLPEQAAVDHLRMHIGERIIEGQIKEREEAKKTYEKARKAGQRASLVEQERPNIFTTSLANIAPGESITVEIEYQQTVHYVDGTFRLRFPMVVGPRYIPGHSADQEQRVSTFAGTGWAQPTSQVPDAARITAPVRLPGTSLANPVTLDIHLDTGIPLASVTSSYHDIEQQQTAAGGYHVRLADGPVPADRDFELVWRPHDDTAPRAAWFTQKQNNQYYGLLMLLPPRQQSETDSIGREVVFVIDTSGSMHGDSIEQARNALLLALERLTAKDRFNVIRFNHSTDSLFPESRSANTGNLAIAHNFVAGLAADGGTEMLPALQTALQDQEETSGIRQVIFLTDGSVGNERELFKVIRKQLGKSRLFTIGIGSAPNSYFMRKAAQYGRGTFTYIGKNSEVMEKMSELFMKLERPALTDIQVDVPQGVTLEMLPGRIPDLYIGEPLLLAFKGQSMPAQLTVSGRMANQSWQTSVTLKGGRQGATLAPEWGRRKITELMTRLHDAENDAARQTLRNEVVATALRHHLVSRYTSLVAVDVTPARKRDELLQQHAMKTNLPRGWSYEHVFGLPRTATAATLQMIIGLLLLIAASSLAYWPRKRPC
ncbi:marine proteobacterial sortase target protein [Thiogranum longum]